MPPLNSLARIHEIRRVLALLTCDLVDREVHEVVCFYRLIYKKLAYFESMNQQGRLLRAAVRRFILQFVISSTNT